MHVLMTGHANFSLEHSTEHPTKGCDWKCHFHSLWTKSPYITLAIKSFCVVNNVLSFLCRYGSDVEMLSVTVDAVSTQNHRNNYYFCTFVMCNVLDCTTTTTNPSD